MKTLRDIFSSWAFLVVFSRGWKTSLAGKLNDQQKVNIYKFYLPLRVDKKSPRWNLWFDNFSCKHIQNPSEE